MRIETSRLILRRWREEDIAAFAALNADPKVMRYFATRRSAEETAAMVAHFERRFEEDGFAFAAVELRDGGDFVGMIGLQAVRAQGLPFEPAVEVGWRLAERFWGNGYATEGAGAVVDHGFRQLGLGEIVAFTTRSNLPSQAVMVRLGMTTNPADDFDHPALPAGHPLRPHVLYRRKRPE